VGVVDIPALTPDTGYTVTLSQGGSAVTVSARTAPQNEIRIVFASCVRAGSPMNSGFEWVRREAHLLLLQDDVPYANRPSTSWHDGTSLESINLTDYWDDVTSYYKAHRSFTTSPGAVEALRQIPSIRQPGDHGWRGNDFDHTVTQANEAFNSGSGNFATLSTQAEVDTAHWTAVQAIKSYCTKGNPGHPDAVDEFPKYGGTKTVDATDESKYPPGYGSCRFGSLVEVFYLEDIVHRSPIGNADSGTYPNHDKTLLGASQRQWLLDQLAASPCTFKVISSNKKTLPNNTDNPDTWANFAVERDGILDWIHNNVTGVIWLTGDRHCASAAASESPDHVMVCACPESMTRVTGGTDYAANVVWVGATERKPGVEMADTYPNYGLLTVTRNYMEVAVMRLGRGAVWRGRVNAGSNALSYPTVQSAV